MEILAAAAVQDAQNGGGMIYYFIAAIAVMWGSLVAIGRFYVKQYQEIVRAYTAASADYKKSLVEITKEIAAIAQRSSLAVEQNTHAMNSFHETAIRCNEHISRIAKQNEKKP